MLPELQKAALGMGALSAESVICRLFARQEKESAWAPGALGALSAWAPRAQAWAFMERLPSAEVAAWSAGCRHLSAKLRFWNVMPFNGAFRRSGLSA